MLFVSFQFLLELFGQLEEFRRILQRLLMSVFENRFGLGTAIGKSRWLVGPLRPASAAKR